MKKKPIKPKNIFVFKSIWINIQKVRMRDGIGKNRCPTNCQRKSKLLTRVSAGGKQEQWENRVTNMMRHAKTLLCQTGRLGFAYLNFFADTLSARLLGCHLVISDFYKRTRDSKAYHDAIAVAKPGRIARLINIEPRRDRGCLLGVFRTCSGC